MDRVKRLLDMGYLPSQLPPCFTTKDLADNHGALYIAWVALQADPKTPKAPSSKAELFSVARAGYRRRLTSLPNPIAQTYLATHIGQHWGQLLKHYRQSRLSASRPRFIKNSSRAATVPSMQLLYEQKIRKAAGYRYMLHADISRFYPTIYTHSVPWALHGKTVAKKNRKPTPKYYGNLLDLTLRQGQEEQTMGVPIGPDTSHIIAEAIATSVDVEFVRHLKAIPAGFRYVDDYYLFFTTEGEADAALASLVRSLKQFELHINYEKTKTCRVVEIADDYWPHRLRSFQFARYGKKQASDIHHFFEMAKELARRNIDESVMMYALKRVSSIVVRKENWDCFEAHLCHVALAYPNVLQSLARILSTYADIKYPLNMRRLQRLVNTVVQEHAPLGHHGEVAWSLWICKNLGIDLNEENVDLISSMHSSVCALLLLDLDRSGRLPKSPKMTYWKQAESPESLYGDLWLLSYEAGIRKWGGFSDVHIVSEPYYFLLLSSNIHFYDEAARTKPIFSVRPEVLGERNIEDVWSLFDLEDVDELVEYDEGDGGYDGGVAGGSANDADEEIEGFEF